MRKMFDLDQEIKGAKRIGIAGHIRPDGDCVGSCLGLGLYLRENYPELEAVDIHLESVPEKFRVLEGTEIFRIRFVIQISRSLCRSRTYSQSQVVVQLLQAV